MTYSLHPGAEQDIADALYFYMEQAGSKVAARFLSEFERIANLLVEHPGFGTPANSGRRVFPPRVFPYSVVYREMEGGIKSLLYGTSTASQATVAPGFRCSEENRGGSDFNSP